MEGFELYDCKVKEGAYPKPKRTYGAYNRDGQPITSAEMNDYIFQFRSVKVLPQIPSSSYVCEEECSIRHPKDRRTKASGTRSIKVYRAGKVQPGGVKGRLQ